MPYSGKPRVQPEIARAIANGAKPNVGMNLPDLKPADVATEEKVKAAFYPDDIKLEAPVYPGDYEIAIKALNKINYLFCHMGIQFEKRTESEKGKRGMRVTLTPANINAYSYAIAQLVSGKVTTGAVKSSIRNFVHRLGEEGYHPYMYLSIE